MALECVNQFLCPITLTVVGLLILPYVNFALTCGRSKVPEFGKYKHVCDFLFNFSNFFYLNNQVAGLDNKGTLDSLHNALSAVQLVEADQVWSPCDDDLVSLVNSHAFDPREELP
jgi:hypothetical protein